MHGVLGMDRKALTVSTLCFKINRAIPALTASLLWLHHQHGSNPAWI
jgi:hypothetical protein